MKSLRRAHCLALSLVLAGAHTLTSAAIVTISGTFDTTFASVPDVSANWVAQFDTTTMEKTVEAGGALTRLSGVSTPTSFQMTPLQLASGSTTYTPDDVRVQVELQNGRLAGVQIGGFRDQNLLLTATTGDFFTSFSDGGRTLDGRASPLVGGFLAYRPTSGGIRFSSSRTATFHVSLADVVDLSSGEVAQYFGGSEHGGLDITFNSGYTGEIVIQPGPSAELYVAPNFSLAMGAESAFWSIRPTSTFDGMVELVFGYDRSLLSVAEEDLAVFHFSSATGSWEQLISSVDTETQTVRAFTSGFSVFTLGERLELGSVSSPPVISLVTLGVLLVMLFCRRRND